MHPTTIGLDLAKHVFQVHGVDVAGKVIIRKKLRRSELKAFFEKLPPCLAGMEACGTAHYWGRELEAFGHDVRHSPGILGTCFYGAPDTIRTCDRCLLGLARNPSPAPAGPLPTHRQSAK
jgi:hypothetical protein